MPIPSDINSSLCTGCTACCSICPTDAISMSEDEKGFYVPLINKDKCVACKLCEKACPLLSETRKTGGNPACFAAYNRNADVRKKSASGGVFPAVAEEVLRSGGYVCGCVLDEKLKVKHIVSCAPADIGRMQDSKYVQSEMGNCFAEIEKLLKEERLVLFTGTSCQVAGLKSYIKNKKISDSKLYTADIVCHGTPSPGVWAEFVAFYEKKKRTELSGYIFRSKKHGWGAKAKTKGYQCSAVKKNGRCDSKSLAAKLWNRIFSSDLCIRPSCNSCKFSDVCKPSDITIGDFWGIDKVLPDMDDGKGCSCVLVHTDKGATLLNSVDSLKLELVEVSNITAKNPNLLRPTPKNPESDAFWKDYSEHSFSYIAKKYFDYSFLNKVKNLIKRILFRMKIRKGL